MPKLTTGFVLTPPSKPKKRKSLPKQKALPDDLFEKLMSCPIKKQLVLKLLHSQRENIEDYKRKEREKNQSPVGKIKQIKHCESPTALLRRRALEQLKNGDPSSNEQSSASRSTSRASNASSDASSETPQVPFDEIMKGVVAYVEIQRGGQDKSSGVKAVMRAMGATVKESFTKEVTHVIFKDGLYTTYRKAQLKGVPLVSVLWVDFSRKNCQRQSEKMYPALGGYNNNVSAICSQMYKEYEDIIKEEYHRSMIGGTPLPTTKSLIERRRTLTTPCTSSQYSFRLSQELPSSQDREVDSIMHRKTNILNPLPIVNESVEITDDESDNELIINGSIFHKTTRNTLLKSLENIVDSSSTGSTDTQGSKSLIPGEKSRRKSSYMNMAEIVSSSTSSPNKKPKKNTRKCLFDIVDNIEGMCVNQTRNSDKTPLVSDKTPLISDKPDHNSEKIPLNSDHRKSTMSALQLNSDKIVDSNITKVTESDHSKSTVSDLKLGSDKTISTRSSMGSLRLNSDKSKSTMSDLKLTDTTKGSANSDMPSLKLNSDKTVNSDMSSLKLNSDKTVNSDMSSLRVCSNVEILSGNICRNIPRRVVISDSKKNASSFVSEEEEMVDRDLILNAIDIIDSPVDKNRNVTVRKKVVNESKSDDSEIVSPDKNGTKQKGLVGRKSKVSPLERAKHVENNKDMITPRRSQRFRMPATPYTPNSARNKAKRVDNVTVRKSRKNLEEEMPKENPVDNNDDSAKKNKKMRKLYNPDDSEPEGVSDEKEREEKRKEAERQRQNNNVFVNPAAVNLNLLFAEKKTQNCDENHDDIPVVKPKKPTKKKKELKKASFDSNADRQENLLNEILDKNKTVAEKLPKKNITVPITPIKKIPEKLPGKDIIIPITPVKRRSTLEFQNMTLQKGSVKKLKQEKTKQPTIVCTKLHQDDVVTFCQIVKKLGGFTVEDEVSNRTTHVVAGEPKRTINMLRAVARGCWVLRHEWLFKSLEEGRWLPEEDFEVTDFAPIVQQSRLQRQAFGPKYTLEVFDGCAPIYVARSANPRCSDLRELITLCRGKVVLDPTMAKIVVGEYFEGVTCVKETWVLDCITQNEVKRFKRYLLAPASKNQRISVVV